MQNTNGKMEVFISESHANTWRTTKGAQWLKAHAGKWEEVDTQYLFNNQYNLTDPDAPRIMDADIDAVRNDVRPRAIKCGYCGWQFIGDENCTHDDLVHAWRDHCDAERAKPISCEHCYSYLWIENTDQRITTETREDGAMVKTETRHYTQKCVADCCHVKQASNAHGDYDPETFTAENTYFIKYPNGYCNYFVALSLDEKMKEYGWSKTDSGYQKGIYDTSYTCAIELENGKLTKIKIFNSRRLFTISGNDIATLLDGPTCAHNKLKFHGSDPLHDLPKTPARDVYSFLNTNIVDIANKRDGRLRLFV